MKIEDTNTFKEAIKYLLHTYNVNEIKIGNVTFWVDNDGPWKDQLSFDIPTDKWNKEEIAKDSRMHEAYKFLIKECFIIS